MRLLSHASALGLLCAGLVAAETPPEKPETQAGEFRVLLGIAPAYAVTEEATPRGGGGTTTYEWEGTEENARVLGLQYVRPFGKANVIGQPIFGLELQISNAELKPTSYTVDGSSFSNNLSERITYVAFTPAAILGLRFAEPEDNELGLIGEVQAMVGLSLIGGYIESDLGTDGSLGYGVDGGVRILLGLKEAGWSGSVIAGVRGGYASISFDQGNPTSDMTLESVGAEVLLAIGHEF